MNLIPNLNQICIINEILIQTSYNGLFVHSPVKAVSDAYDQEQRNNHWLSPPVSNNFRMLFNIYVIEVYRKIMRRAQWEIKCQHDRNQIFTLIKIEIMSLKFEVKEICLLIIFQIELNRRASDSGAHLLLFQQQYGVTGSNTIGANQPTHIQSPVSNVKKN